jgi:hypothetical protein
MKFVCDTPGPKSWFWIETEAEAALESDAMGHAVEKHFAQAWQVAARSYRAIPGSFVEQNIGLKAHIRSVMPMFLTLRSPDGQALATAMLPPGGRYDPAGRIIIVGPANRDPYPEHGEAIRILGEHFGLTLDRVACYPYAGVAASRK